MRTIVADNSVVNALSAVYPHDDAVSFSQTVEKTTDGYVLRSSEIFGNMRDVNGTQLTSAFLTSQMSLSTVASISTPVQTTTYFITYLQSTRTGLYVQLNSDNLTPGWSTTITPRCIFEVILVDSFTVQVRFYTGTEYKYLTKDPNSTRLNFSNLSAGLTQTFSYFWDQKANQLAFFSGAAFVQEAAGMLQLVTGSTLGNTNVWNTRQNNLIPALTQLQQTWNSYLSGIEVNTVKILPNRCITDLDNNYLLFANHNDIDLANGKLSVDFIPLKNQLNVDNNTSRGNVFNLEAEVQHRDYHALHIDGNFITAGYTSGVKPIHLPVDTLTYFYFPYVSSPFIVLNINDSSLIKAGAVAGDIPINSDKVFKKRSPDYNDFTITDEQNGTWLCAWLSGSPTPNVPPIWVDRYYNPNFVNFYSALTAANNGGTTYIDLFSNTVINNGMQNQIIFDLPSKLVFESHALYAYHHLGTKDYQHLLDTRTYALVTSGADTYKNYGGAVLIPEFDGLIETYDFTGTQVATITSRNIQGSFTLAFNLFADDYQHLFANQLVGYYGLSGVGIFNELSGSPLLTARVGVNTDQYTLSYNLSSLQFGWHSVALVFNTEQGSAQFYIDNFLVDSTTFTPGKYTFNTFFTDTLQIGTSAASACKIKDIQLYDIPFTPFDVRNYTFRTAQVRDINWDMPTGARNYLDSIERFFRFTIPGRKANTYNITIQNSHITDPTVQAAIQEQLQTIVLNVAPAYTQLNQIIWRENV